MLVEVPVTLNTAKGHPFDGHFNNDGQQTNNEDNCGTDRHSGLCMYISAGEIPTSHEHHITASPEEAGV